MKKQMQYLIMIIGGLLLLVAGLLILKTQVSEGIMQTLPYIFIGVGCGIFGHGMGIWIQAKTLAKSPDAYRQIAIESKDERNILIANQAKAKAYDSMIYIFAALLLTFSLMGVDAVLVLMLVGCYLLVVGISIYYRIKFDKEM